MIKMVVTDLDDTLLRSDKSISSYTTEILKEVRHKGVKVIFATARGGTTKSLVPYELFDGYILLNGAKAYANDRLIYDKTISAAVFAPFLHTLSERNFRVAAEIDGIHYANFNVKEEWQYIDNFVITDYSGALGDADKLYALIENQTQVDMIASILPKDLYLNLSRDNLVMIMHKEATKYNGILAVANKFGILDHEIVAFGDDINDKEMLQKVGIGIAMGNSIDEIKMIADHICDTNDNDGVAKWLEDNMIQAKNYT